MSRIHLLALPLLLQPVGAMAGCLSDADLMLVGQTSYVKKMSSIWQIDGTNPYTANNGYQDLAINYSGNCSLIEDKLNLDLSLYGVGYFPVKESGAFEKDDNRMRILLDRTVFSYNVSDSIRVDAGKISPKSGNFYLKSPAGLLNTYYAGFKPTRIYLPSFKSVYAESFWGTVLTQDTPTYSLSFTLSPKLTHIDKRYESSSNWSATERSNASERYLLTYTDYRLANYTPSVSVMLGDKKSIALSNSYNISPQMIINAELAWHKQQQWRHLDEESAQQIEHYAFPSELYNAKDEQGVELALGLQYTTDSFSQIGAEYYFQSEGYSAAQWRQQTRLVNFLNQRTHYSPLDNAFDAYKYLMASEIYNTSSQGNLMGKHYIHTYANFLMAGQSTLQPYMVFNLMDNSAMLGLSLSKPLPRWDRQLEIYAGVYASVGNKDSEFGLFGETFGNYLGFKYHF